MQAYGGLSAATLVAGQALQSRLQLPHLVDRPTCWFRHPLLAKTNLHDRYPGHGHGHGQVPYVSAAAGHRGDTQVLLREVALGPFVVQALDHGFLKSQHSINRKHKRQTQVVDIPTACRRACCPARDGAREPRTSFEPRLGWFGLRWLSSFCLFFKGSYDPVRRSVRLLA